MAQASIPSSTIDNLPATLNIGPGSPTGCTFGYGAKFPAKYQDAFYALDWSWGKIYAVHLTPNGSTYTATKEEFVTGGPLPVSDAIIGKDGAMYFTIGGRRVQSGLYRVTYVGKDSTKIRANPKKDQSHYQTAKYAGINGHLREPQPDGNPPRSLPRQTRPQSRLPPPGRISAALTAMSAPPPALRWSISRSIEWQDKALAETNVTAQLEALLALTRRHRRLPDPSDRSVLSARFQIPRRHPRSTAEA